MKYMTKDWYESMQKICVHILLNVSERAETFSEDFFKELYDKEKAQWINLQKSSYEADVDDIFPIVTHGMYLDGTEANSEKIEQLNKTNNEMREKFIETRKNREPFDPEREENYFKETIEFRINNMKFKLPEYILKKVADIRVLALDYVSDEAMDEIMLFCEEHEAITERRPKEYDNDPDNVYRDDPPQFAREFNFHDSEVLSCSEQGSDYVMELNSCFTQMDKIVFRNCKVIESDGSLIGATWLYYEIYKTEGGYEIHVLLHGLKGLQYFTVVTEDVVLS